MNFFKNTSFVVEGIWTSAAVCCALTFLTLNWFGVNTLISGGFMALVLGAVYCYATSPLRGLPNLPGPKGAKHFIGHLDAMLCGTKFWIWFDDMVKKYDGKPFKVYFGRQPTIVVSDLDQIKDVFVTQFSESFHSRPPTPGPFDNNNLFTQIGDDWRSSRRALAPSFNTRNLSYFAEAMNLAALEFVQRINKLSPGEEIDIYRYYGGLTLQVICATSFGRYMPQGGEADDKLVECLRMIVSPEGGGHKAQFYFQAAFPFVLTYMSKLPIPPIRKMNDAIDYINTTTGDMATQLKEGKAFGDEQKLWKSFIGLLLNAKDKETGKTLDQREITGQSLLFIFAGYETTASTLALMTYEIAKQPYIQRKIQDEIDKAREDESPVTYKDLGKLNYLGWVIQETLRLYPIATLMNRETFKDCTVGGYKIPCGSGVIVPTWTIHRDPKQFPNPEAFIPERWDPEGEEQQKRHPMAWHPFGEGPRKCIGYRFALQEMKIVIANLLKEYSFSLSPKRTDHLIANSDTGIIPTHVYVIPERRT